MSGLINSNSGLTGKLSSNGCLSGTLSNATKTDCDIYEGEYSVTPKAFKSQSLNTSNKLLTKDIQVAEIPYFETSNQSNGKTVYIAKEV